MMLDSRDNSIVWQNQASQWMKIGSPLRPTQKDGELMMKSLAPLMHALSEFNVVILGITPEIVNLPWPKNVSLKAFDQSADMIKRQWKPNLSINCSVEQEKWQAMSLGNSSVDAVLGDGVLTVLPSRNDYIEVLSEIKRVLKPNGVLIFRCFVNKESQETPLDVQKSFLLGEIHSFHVLKWRFAMSLVTDKDFSIKVSDIYEQFNLYFPDREKVAKYLKCDVDIINTIDAYKESMESYTFLSLSKLLSILETMYEIKTIDYGDYELANRCPTICCKSKSPSVL